jgi:hypothetical protein
MGAMARQPEAVLDTQKSPRSWNVVLVLAAVFAVGLCAWFYLGSKTSFLDDSFIYLHIAGNAVEAGSAQYYPIVDNPGLLASSPLRLLVLIPSTLLAWLFVDARSIDAVRLTFVISLIVTCLLFLPFYRGRPRRWLWGCAFAAFVGITTETGLQMEGVLLFWSVLTLITFPPSQPSSGHWFAPMGLAVALLTLTRPEYGLITLTLMLVYLVWKRDWTSIRRVLVPVGLAAALWVFVSWVLLDVYPIPTTYITKVLQGEQGGLTSDGSFFNVFGERIGSYFGGGQPAALIVVGAVLVAALWEAGGLFRWVIPMLALVLIVSRGAAGNFLWYHENFYVVCLTVFAGAILDMRGQLHTWRSRATTVAMALPLLLFSKNVLKDRPMTWNFRSAQSRGLSYEALAEYHVGSGVFVLPDLEPTYLQVDEIGIVSYFGGSDVWLLDRSGLAQPGNYRGIAEHKLARVYPRSIFRRARDEYAMMLERAGAGAPARVFLAVGNPSAQNRHVCQRYYPETGICLLELKLSHR